MHGEKLALKLLLLKTRCSCFIRPCFYFESYEQKSCFPRCATLVHGWMDGAYSEYLSKVLLNKSSKAVCPDGSYPSDIPVCTIYFCLVLLIQTVFLCPNSPECSGSLCLSCVLCQVSRKQSVERGGVWFTVLRPDSLAVSSTCRNIARHCYRSLGCSPSKSQNFSPNFSNRTISTPSLGIHRYSYEPLSEFMEVKFWVFFFNWLLYLELGAQVKAWQ